MEQQLVRNLQARQKDLERDIERLKQLQDSILCYGFSGVNNAIEQEIADRKFFFDDIENDLKVEYVLSTGINRETI